MYYTRGTLVEAGPIKNAHHSHERERMLVKRKFMDFVSEYRRTHFKPPAKNLPADKLDFCDYMRMLDTRTTDQPTQQPQERQRLRATSHYCHNRKKSRIIDSCQPYFITTIPRTATDSKDSSKADYSRMKRVDPLPLQRARRSNLV